MRRLLAQTRIELLLTLRRGESVLLTLGIPVLLLVFFSTVDVLPTGTDDPVDFLFPGVLALAVMSTAMVSLAIATGFERQTGVLKRLGVHPARPARSCWRRRPSPSSSSRPADRSARRGGSAPRVRPRHGQHRAGPAGAAARHDRLRRHRPADGRHTARPHDLAAANGLYLVLLLLGGMVIPLTKLPGALRVTARGLPAGALSDVFHGALDGGAAPARAWLVLATWAVITPVAAAACFRWE